jgi:type IV secretion system protein VirB4
MKGKPMSKWIGPAAWSNREAKASDRLPYRRHIDAETIELRDGSIMRSIQVEGIAFETEDSDTLNHLLSAREVILRSVLDARFVLYHHVIRRRVAVELADLDADRFSDGLNRRWSERLGDRSLFVNEQFLTLVLRPARGKAGAIDRLGRRLRRNSDTSSADLRTLDSAIAGLLAALQPYNARPLTCYDLGRATASEPLELLSALYNGEWRPVVVSGAESDLGGHLPYRRLSFGLDAMETRSAGSRDFAAMLGLKEYPDATAPGVIDSLLRLPFEFVLTESFAPSDRQIAKERIDLALRRSRAGDEESATIRVEMHAARDALSAGQASFGDHHLSLLVREQSLGALDGAMAAAAAALADIGAVAVREDVNLEPAFWAQFPGNEAYAVRRGLVSSANIAGMMSLHGFPAGRAAGNHWGDAVTVLETSAATPYFFNFHNGDLGNFTVIGPSGSGKTVVLNFLAAQAQKFAPRTILFDKDRGSEIFVRSIGGHYARLSPGQATGFNPLKLPDSPANRAFLRDWLACLLDASDAGELATVARAVDASYDYSSRLRRLSNFRELLSGGRRPEQGDLASRLEPWIGAGEHSWLFDNPDDALRLDRNVCGFDMTALLDQPRLRTPAMMYLFHRVDERLDGDPTMILIDEGWKALDDPVFAARIRDWLKTLRKRNAIVGFATQSARDALDSRISAAIVEQTATMIFMPNAKAREEDYCGGFGLTEHELALIRALPAHSRCFLVRHADHSVVVRLDLSGMTDILTVLSGRESSTRRLDALRESVGDDPTCWYPMLTGRAWPGEADQLQFLEAAE